MRQSPAGQLHAADDARAAPRPILARVLSAAVVLLEGLGGLLANSLALLADAGHVLADRCARGLTLFALHQARRPAEQGHSHSH